MWETPKTFFKVQNEDMVTHCFSSSELGWECDQSQCPGPSHSRSGEQAGVLPAMAEDIFVQTDGIICQPGELWAPV